MNGLSQIARRMFKILGSYGLACIVLMLLFVLTLFGTLEQQTQSLQAVRDKYFDSLFFMSDYGIPLPGGYLLMAVLAVNLVVGGMVRMRFTMSRVGVLTIHIGIAVLLLSGLIEYHTSRKGYMTLVEGQSSAEFRSHEHWDLSIIENLRNGRERVHVIPDDRLPDPGESMRYHAAGLPFEVELTGVLGNCQPRPARGDEGVDGFVLQELGSASEGEAEVPGMTVRLIAPSGETREALLWGLQRAPFKTQIGSRNWAVDLHKRRWPLPFKVTLRKFTKEDHPRTNMPSSFSSDITRLEENVAQDVHISMNDPMRHRGYTFYQSGWGPQNGDPNARLFSTFSVVENPADQGPLYACIIIGVGLLIQFLRKLYLYTLREEWKRA